MKPFTTLTAVSERNTLK